MKLKITTLVIVEEGQVQTQELTSIGFKTAILDL